MFLLSIFICIACIAAYHWHRFVEREQIMERIEAGDDAVTEISVRKWRSLGFLLG